MKTNDTAEEFYSQLQKAVGFDEKKFMEHLANRRFVPIFGRITDEAAEGITKVLVTMDFKKISPIALLIASGGGDVSSAQRVIDVMNVLQSPVDGLVVGRAASMAIDILLACRNRHGLPNSQYFVHFSRCGFNIIRDSDEITGLDMKTLKQQLLSGEKERKQFYAQKLKKSVREITQLFHMGEKFKIEYSAREAIGLGIIQGVETKFKYLMPMEASVAHREAFREG